MVQDIGPCKFYNHYVNAKPTEKDTAVFVRENAVLLAEKDGRKFFPVFGALKETVTEAVYLFSVDERRFFLVSEQDRDRISETMSDYRYCRLPELRGQSPRWVCFTAAVACQAAHWYQANRYCGRCGHSMEPDQKERMMRCDHCGNVVYPKICPVVIVGVIHGDEIIMTKYAGGNGRNYALIAGFAEIGETIEETVQREVMEEVGVQVKNFRYYKSQPWPFSDSLLFGFFCEVDGDPQITMDPGELSYAEWVPRQEMTVTDDHFSLTYEMMALFKEKGAAVLEG